MSHPTRSRRPGSRRWALGPAAAAAAVLAAACTSLPGTSDSPRTEGTPTAESRTPVTTTSARETGQADSTLANRGKGKPLATFEGDLVCSKLVAPFDLSENAAILTELGVNGIFRTLGVAFDQWIQGTTAKLASQNALKAEQHNISYELRATAVRMNWLPMQAEVLYGRTILETMKKTGGIESPDSEQGVKLYAKAQALLDDTLKGVDEAHDYKFQVYVSMSSDQNAQALPGGIIVIDRALLTDANARRARFAVAHEVGHVLQRHETRAVQARIIDAVSLRASLPDLAKVIGETKNDPSAVLSLLLAGKLQFERHFANQELHSDGCGVRILEKRLGNDTELVAVLSAFVQGLPKPAEDSKPDPTVKRSLPGGLDLVSATAKDVQKSANDLSDLITLVTRPMDRHPTTAARVENLNRTLADIKKRRDAAAKKGKGEKAKGQAPVLPKPPSPKASASTGR